MKNQELLALIKSICDEGLADREYNAAWPMSTATRHRESFEKIKYAIENPHCEQCESSQPTGVVCDECKVKPLCQRCGINPADGSGIMCTDCWIATGEPSCPV